MTMIEWNMPWLLLIALQPAAVFVLRHYFNNRHIQRYTSPACQPWVVVPHLQKDNQPLRLLNASYILAWLLFAIAAAGPRIAQDIPEAVKHYTSDIMLVVDISQSMHATDLGPDRLGFAQKKINYLINHAPHSRIGIIVYAAKPHLYVPLTYDKKALAFYLKNLPFLVPPSQGTLPAAAIHLASQQLSAQERNNQSRATSIILITDADTQDDDKLLSGDTAIYTLITASQHGEAIPAFQQGWLTEAGRPIISRPNTAFYQQLSENNQGILEQARKDNKDIAAIMDDIRARQTLLTTENEQLVWHELFGLFLAPAIVLLFINLFPYRISILTLAAGLSLMMLIAAPLQANQHDALGKAYQALVSKDYVKAREYYARIDGFDGKFGEAVASYQLADYSHAIRQFEKAVLLAESDNEYAQALYNLANSYFQIGDYAQAVASFESALLYQPNHLASVKNLAYARKALLAVEARKKLIAITTRAGRGPRSAMAADNMTLTDNQAISLGNGESDLDVQNNTANLSDVDIPDFIILKGLEFANAAEINEQANGLNTRQTTTTLNLSRLDHLLDNQAILWRRIFEREEGYPAPLDEPDVLPGIAPW